MLHTIDNGPTRKFKDFASWDEERRKAYPKVVHLSRSSYMMVINHRGDKDFVLLAQWFADCGAHPSNGLLAVQPKHIAEELMNA
jgi:hypothetical protein